MYNLLNLLRNLLNLLLNRRKTCRHLLQSRSSHGKPKLREKLRKDSKKLRLHRKPKKQEQRMQRMWYP